MARHAVAAAWLAVAVRAATDVPLATFDGAAASSFEFKVRYLSWSCTRLSAELVSGFVIIEPLGCT